LCKNGINLTQFKLSIHQLSLFNETLAKSLEQWSNLTKSLGFESLSREIEETSKLAEALKNSLESLIKAADEAEASNDDITITPI
jgi:predicted Zn-dependent protease